MKVLIISLAYLPFVGGAELAVKEITNWIGDIEFDLVTVNLDGKQPREEKIGNVKIYRVGKGKLSKYLFPFLGFKKAKELQQQNNYDAIWAIMANQAGLVALKFKKCFPEVKYLLTLQEGDSLKSIWLRTWFIRPWYKAIYTQADYVQTISNFLKNRAAKYGYQGKIEVVPNGVNFNHFNSVSSGETEGLREKIGLRPEDKVLVTSSRLVKKNALDILIKSIKDLEVKLLILGSGKQESKLKALTQELGLKDKVLFLGYITHQDLPRYLKLADIFVRPSRSEGLGTAFLEAMAAGLPIIATKVGGIPDFLQDGQTGLFCAVNNPRDLRDKIQLLLTDNQSREKLINQGQNLVAEKYSWQSAAERIKGIFNQLGAKK